MAETRPVSPSEFEKLVTGKTFAYSARGAAYGAESYLGGRRVTWTFNDGQCHEGEWYASGEKICFIYETISSPQCWTYFMNGGKLEAMFASDPTATTVYKTDEMGEPLFCPGPKVGV